MIRLFKLMIQMFNCGLLDHIRNFQGIFERLYIRHRLLDDLAYSGNNNRYTSEQQASA